MNKSKNFKVRLGIFIVAGLLIFITGIYFLGKKQNLFGSTFTVRGFFHNVGGLQVGNNVRFSGINVGTVESIKIISDTTVLVECIIDASVRPFIKKNAKVMVGAEGLMGNKVINVMPGTTEYSPVDNNDTLTTIKPLEIDDILKNVKATAANAETITNNLAFLTNDIREGKGVIGKLFRDSLMANKMDRMMGNLNKSSKSLSENMEAVKGSFLLKPLFKKKDKKEKQEDKATEEKKNAEPEKDNQSRQERREERKAEKQKENTEDKK